ncbi:hypothetical protein ACKGJN_05900 [Gillisia sp. Q332]|uniref:hypothetical protein n=1 Tax=Gillisia xinjiangensis TaxID=3384765 RepID=UPI00391C3396
MKKLNYLLSYIAILALLFTSCSKEETAVDPNVQETFQIQFGTLLNDFNKQQQDPVECRDADPAYVLVALTDDSDAWVANKNPEAPGADADDFIKINIKNNSGSWETEYSEDLGLPAGTYQLEYFIVYSADHQVLWVAPREGGAYAGSVGDPLPQEIVLGAGTKPYIEVDVLCFVPREEEAFGYIFFDINLIEVENNYCIFVNYCDDETGREYPALFEVDVWADGYDGSEVIVDGEMNSVSGAGNSFAATVLCFPLSPLGEGELYYVRVTVLDAGAYDADASDFFEFTITQTDITAQLSLVPAYRHVRINCGDDDNGNGECDPLDPNDDCNGNDIPNKCDPEAANYDNFDCDGDEVRNLDDDCPDVAGTLPNGCVDETDPCANLQAVCSIPQTEEDLEVGCAFAYFDSDNQDAFLKIENAETGLLLENIIGDPYGSVNTSLSNGDVSLSIDGNFPDDLIIAYEIEVRPSNQDGSMSASCWESSCDPDVIAFDSLNREQAAIDLSFSTFNYSYPYYIRVKAISCAASASGP